MSNWFLIIIIAILSNHAYRNYQPPIQHVETLFTHDSTYHRALAYLYGDIFDIPKNTTISLYYLDQLIEKANHTNAMYVKSHLSSNWLDRYQLLYESVHENHTESIEDLAIIHATMNLPKSLVIPSFRLCAEEGFIYSKTVMCLSGEEKYCEGLLHIDAFSLYEYSQEHAALMEKVKLQYKAIDRKELVRQGIYHSFGLYPVSKKLSTLPEKFTETITDWLKKTKQITDSDELKETTTAKKTYDQHVSLENKKPKIKKIKPKKQTKVQQNTIKPVEKAEECSKYAELATMPGNLIAYLQALKECAEVQNHADSQFILGMALTDPEKSMKYFKMASVNNHLGAIDKIIEHLQTNDSDSDELIKMFAKRNKIKNK